MIESQMDRVLVVMHVHFDKDRISNGKEATEFLADVVRQVGQHTVAKYVAGSVMVNGFPTGRARYDGELNSEIIRE